MTFLHVRLSAFLWVQCSESPCCTSMAVVTVFFLYSGILHVIHQLFPALCLASPWEVCVSWYLEVEWGYISVTWGCDVFRF